MSAFPKMLRAHRVNYVKRSPVPPPQQAEPYSILENPDLFVPEFKPSEQRDNLYELDSCQPELDRKHLIVDV